MTQKTVRQGELVRCNRCDGLGHIDRDVTATRESDRAYRLQDMARIEECGHLDCHWQYDRDQFEAESAERHQRQQFGARMKRTGNA